MMCNTELWSIALFWLSDNGMREEPSDERLVGVPGRCDARLADIIRKCCNEDITN